MITILMEHKEAAPLLPVTRRVSPIEAKDQICQINHYRMVRSAMFCSTNNKQKQPKNLQITFLFPPLPHPPAPLSSVPSCRLMLLARTEIFTPDSRRTCENSRDFAHARCQHCVRERKKFFISYQPKMHEERY